MEKETNIVKQILRNEITWLVCICGATWGFVSTVVLPIQALQIGQTKIQEQLTIESNKYGQFEGRLGKLEVEHALLKDKFNIK